MSTNWVGLLIGVGGLLLGQALEGGSLAQLLVPTAAVIVFGGTFGATLLSCTRDEMARAWKSLRKVFLDPPRDYAPTVKQIVDLAIQARREGVLSLERVLPSVENTFLATNLRHLIDGYEPGLLREMMEEGIAREEEERAGTARVFETAGGFAPTVGIIGAVLGLIHVMSNLADSSKLGSGIAVAFVATVYGVASANLLFIPLANKVRKLSQQEILELQIISLGLLSLQSGLNPRVIEDRLGNLLGEKPVGETTPVITLEKKVA